MTCLLSTTRFDDCQSQPSAGSNRQRIRYEQDFNVRLKTENMEPN